MREVGVIVYDVEFSVPACAKGMFAAGEDVVKYAS